jgi:ATP-dependent DNA helicase RecG
LPKDIKYILKEDFSMPRNPIIARIFRVIKLSENIGSGFEKMITGWNEYYGNKPVISGDFDYYKIAFYFDKPSSKATTQVSPQVDLSKLESKLLKKIKENPKISRSELSKDLGIGSDTVKEYLERLKKKGALKRIGKSNSGYWAIEAA